MSINNNIPISYSLPPLHNISTENYVPVEVILCGILGILLSLLTRFSFCSQHWIKLECHCGYICRDLQACKVQKLCFFFFLFSFLVWKKTSINGIHSVLKLACITGVIGRGAFFLTPPPPSLIMPAMHTRLVKANLSPFQEPLMLVGSIHQLFSKYFCFFCELPCKAVQLF